MDTHPGYFLFRERKEREMCVGRQGSRDEFDDTALQSNMLLGAGNILIKMWREF